MRYLVFSLLLISSVASFSQSFKADLLHEEFVQLVSVRNYKDATKKMEKLLKLDLPVEDRISYNLEMGILVRDSLRNTKKAAKWFDNAHKQEKLLLAQKKNDLDIQDLLAVHYCLGEMQDSACNYDKMREISDCGLQLYDQLANTNRLSEESRHSLFEMRAMLYNNRAISFAKQKRYEDASREYDKVQAVIAEAINDDKYGSPLHYTFKWMMNMMHVRMYARTVGDKQKALEVAKRMIPEIERAIQVDDEKWRKILELQGPLYIYHIANAYFEAGQYGESLNYCNDGLTWPSNMYIAILQDLKGQSLLKLGRSDEAKECWQKVKEASPFFYKKANESLMKDSFGI